jgi:hypothetical protein
MQCISEILTKARTTGKDVLEKTLYKMHMVPLLMEAILQGIYFWEDGTEYELDKDSNKFLFNEAHTALLLSRDMSPKSGDIYRNNTIYIQKLYKEKNLLRTTGW